jgi:hypothetical protein
VNLELIPKLRHSLASTIGRGTEVQVTAVRSYAPLVVGLAVEDALQDPGAFSRRDRGLRVRSLGVRQRLARGEPGHDVRAMLDLVSGLLSEGERGSVLATNAERVYGLDKGPGKMPTEEEK